MSDADIDHLLGQNAPAIFWRVTSHPKPLEADWTRAVQSAARILPSSCLNDGMATSSILAQTLGEGQFGGDRWRLSAAQRLYYNLKPLLPRAMTLPLRRIYKTRSQRRFHLHWPIEDRYARFQWEIVRQLILQTEEAELQFIHFWPDGSRFALVLTHDVETAAGQINVRRVADIEERLGLRSSFNFVPERYELDHKLIKELRERGFEIGLHGLKHDGKLFNSRREFAKRAIRINKYLRDLGAVGFRSPFTHRQLLWMQDLEIDYDLSFFDTDPFEPMPGGTMSIWPVLFGRFVELPYTLPQDHTLLSILGESTSRIWMQKLEFIRANWGLALVNTHPDYLANRRFESVYEDFLEKAALMENCWHALPRDAANWWRKRAMVETLTTLPRAVLSTASIRNGEVQIVPKSGNSVGRRQALPNEARDQGKLELRQHWRVPSKQERDRDST